MAKIKGNPIITSATEAARKSWEAYVDSQLEELVKVFEGAAQIIQGKIYTSARSDVIQQQRLQALQETIAAELKGVREHMLQRAKHRVEYSIHAALEDSIKVMSKVRVDGIQLGSSYFTSAGILRRWSPAKGTYASSAWANIHKNALDHLMRYRPWGLTLSQEVWNVTWQTQVQLYRRLGMAVVTGEKVSTLIPEIRHLLGVSTKQTMIAQKLLNPGTGIYRSMTANASRLIRTELNRAYVEGGHRYMMQKDFITGVIHRVGSGRPCDDCADLDGNFYPKGEYSEIPVHPHCMCYEEFVIEDRLAA